MNSIFSLAEMANTADYAAMNYGELLKTKLAFTGAIGLQINPLLETKRLEEMGTITHIFMTAMNAYDATRSEILSCLEHEGMKEKHMFSSEQDVDDQTIDVAPDNTTECVHQEAEPILALPEHIEDKTDSSNKFVPWDEMIKLLCECNENVLDKLMSTPPKMKKQDAAPADPDSIDLWEYWASLAGVDTQEDETAQDDSASSLPEVKPYAALPEHVDDVDNQVTLESVDCVTWSSDDEPIVQDDGNQATKEETLAIRALEVVKECRIPQEIDANAPYFVDYTICFGENGDIRKDGKHGRNLDVKDLEDFRAVSETYMKIFLKKEVLMSTEDYLVVKDGEKRIKVRLYHFPENGGMNEEESKMVSYSNRIPDYVVIDLHKTHRRIRKAMEKAKEYTESLGSSSSPFYDKYLFRDNGAHAELHNDPVRIVEDVDTLARIKSAFETYARFYKEGTIVISEDNCIAAEMDNDYIYMLVFNFPGQEKTTVPEKKRRRTRKKVSEPTAKDISVSEEPTMVSNTSPAQTERDLILKAVEMSQTLPVASGTDTSTPFYVQHSFSITNEGDLIYNGKPFSENVTLEGFDRYRKSHRKFARAMKANTLVSTNDYTAFISNDGKSLTIYTYNTVGNNASAK